MHAAERQITACVITCSEVLPRKGESLRAHIKTTQALMKPRPACASGLPAALGRRASDNAPLRARKASHLRVCGLLLLLLLILCLFSSQRAIVCCGRQAG